MKAGDRYSLFEATTPTVTVSKHLVRNYPNTLMHKTISNQETPRNYSGKEHPPTELKNPKTPVR